MRQLFHPNALRKSNFAFPGRLGPVRLPRFTTSRHRRCMQCHHSGHNSSGFAKLRSSSSSDFYQFWSYHHFNNQRASSGNDLCRTANCFWFRLRSAVNKVRRNDGWLAETFRVWYLCYYFKHLLPGSLHASNSSHWHYVVSIFSLDFCRRVVLLIHKQRFFRSQSEP